MSSTKTFAADGVPRGDTYAVLYSVLVAMSVVALLTLKPSILPKKIRRFFSLNREEDGGARGADWFLAARNSLNWKSIALSYFAGQIGAWCIYAPPELGATASLSWVAVLGYAIASAFPAAIILAIGPQIRKFSGEKAFCTTDFARKRFGRVMHVITLAVSFLYCFIFLVAELTSVANVFGEISGLDVTTDDDKDYTVAITVSVCAFTTFYSCLAGLPASLVTDKIQAVVMLMLMTVLFFAATCDKSNRVR